MQVDTQTVTENEWSGLIWLASSLFGIGVILIGIVWRSQVEQQKEQLKEQKKLIEIVSALALDIAIIKTNGQTTTRDVSDIKKDVDEIKKEITGIDKRVSKLEVIK